MILTLTNRWLGIEMFDDLEDIALADEKLTSHTEVLTASYDKAQDALVGYKSHSLDLIRGVYHSVRSDGTVQVWEDYTHCPLWQVYSERKVKWRTDIKERRQKQRDDFLLRQAEFREKKLAKKTRKNAALLLAGHDERGSKAKRR